MIADTSRWLPEFRKLSAGDREWLAGFIADMEAGGDKLGARRLQDALSCPRLHNALHKPFACNGTPEKWPLILAVMHMLPYCMRYPDSPEGRGFVRVPDSVIRDSYKNEAYLLRRLMDVRVDRKRVLANIDADLLDEPEFRGVLGNPLWRQKVYAEAAKTRPHYRGKVVDSTPGTYEKRRIFTDLRDSSTRLHERQFTQVVIAEICSAVLGQGVTIDEVKSTFREKKKV